jgi:hypothetical protein
MINGAHAIIYSTDADADRRFLRDVLKLTHVDVGGGWLIFGLPPSEVAVHPSAANDVHELYLMCEDVDAFVADMRRHDLVCEPVQDQGWGRLTRVTLPSGGQLGVYEPRHARPRPIGAARAQRSSAKRSKKRGTQPSARGRRSRKTGSRAGKTGR